MVRVSVLLFLLPFDMAARASAVAMPSSGKGASDASNLLFLPFDVLRVPELKLRYPTSLPSWGVVFTITFVIYYLITAGIIYDRIVEPPAIGSEQDPRTGAIKPVAFVAYRINGQFIIEVLLLHLCLSRLFIVRRVCRRLSSSVLVVLVSFFWSLVEQRNPVKQLAWLCSLQADVAWSFHLLCFACLFALRFPIIWWEWNERRSSVFVNLNTLPHKS